MSDARRTAAIVSVSIATALSASAVLYATFEAYAPLRSLRLARASGWLAAVLLAFALCVTPLKNLRERLGKSPLPVLHALRRSFGITAAVFAVIHATYSLAAIPGLLGLISSTAWLRAGIAALLVLLALFATSFDAVLRRCRLQHWKELHRLVYVAAILLVMHSALGPFGSVAVELTFAAVLGVSLLVRASLLRGSRSTKTN